MALQTLPLDGCVPPKSCYTVLVNLHNKLGLRFLFRLAGVFLALPNTAERKSEASLAWEPTLKVLEGLRDFSNDALTSPLPR